MRSSEEVNGVGHDGEKCVRSSGVGSCTRDASEDEGGPGGPLQAICELGRCYSAGPPLPEASRAPFSNLRSHLTTIGIVFL